MAGIAAAVALAERGLCPLLVESRPFLGGRARSFTRGPGGDEIDNGQHLMMGCYHATLQLLRTLGTVGFVRIQPRLDVAFRNADGTPDRLLAAEHLPSRLAVPAGLLRMKGLTPLERLQLLRVASNARRGGARASETVRDWMTRIGQSPRAQARLWDPLAIATMNTPAERASAVLLQDILRLAFFGTGRDDSKLAVSTVGLSRLVEPAAEFLGARGGTVLTGAPVRAISWNARRYEVHLGDGRVLETNSLISTLPPRALSALIRSTPLQDAIAIAPELLEPSPIVSLYLWIDGPVRSIPPICALIGTATQWVFNRRHGDVGAESADRPGLLSCTISAAHAAAEQSADVVADRAFAEIRSAFPELPPTQLADSLVIRERFATIQQTPRSDALRPRARTALPGLFLAGDWTATGLPATIEGAVRSGGAAAALVESG